MEKVAKKASVKEAPATEAESSQADSSGKMPVWDRQSGRVKSAIWKRDQKGKLRYTAAIYRSYRDDEDGKWKNVHYYDERDLEDVRTLAYEAQGQILRLKGLAPAVGED